MPTPYILKVQFVGVTKSSYGLGKDELVNVLLKHTHVHTHIGLRVGLLSLGLLVFVFLKGLNLKMRCMSEFKDSRDSCLLVGLTRIAFCVHLRVQKDPEGTSSLSPPLWRWASFRQAACNALNSHCWASA